MMTTKKNKVIARVEKHRVIYLDSYTWRWKEAEVFKALKNYVIILGVHHKTGEISEIKIHRRRIKNRSEIWPLANEK